MKRLKVIAFLGLILMAGFLSQYVLNQTTPVYEWDFGDGSAKDGSQNPVHTYTSAGSWNWVMKVTQNGETCTKSGSITVKPKPAWTFLLYLAGDNDLSGLFTKTILNLEKLAANPNVNLLVLFDGPQTNDTLRLWIQPGGQYTNDVNRWMMGELNMGDLQTLQGFVDWGRQNFPADNYYLSIVDHGRGTTGIAFDNTSKDALTPLEVSQALKYAT